jgi:putative transposase
MRTSVAFMIAVLPIGSLVSSCAPGWPATPAALPPPSPRRMPAKLAEPDYPGHAFERRVRNAGTCRCKSRQLFLSGPWLQDWSALEETSDGMWWIYVYGVLLTRLDERDVTLRRWG